MTIKLNIQVYGDVTPNPTLLIAHGLFGSGRNWRAIAKRLSSDRQVITVDMRNHGDSFWDSDHSYPAMADDLTQTLKDISGPVDVLGHSMGGKAAMILALRNPPNMNRLIVADIAPVAYAHSQISNVDVMESLDITNITRRGQADELLMDQIQEAATRAFLLQSLNLSETGNSWKLNLSALRHNMDHIVGFPEVLGTFTHDVIFIKGALSEYVLPEHAQTIQSLFPNYTVEEIPNAGHWVHAEAPRPFLQAVTGFLSNLPSSVS
jgi:pimeloyl-ACP methyl ester carboxylesterase